MNFESVIAMVVMGVVSALAYLLHGAKQDNQKLNEQVLDQNIKTRLGESDEAYKESKVTADESVDYYNKLKSELPSPAAGETATDTKPST